MKKLKTVEDRVRNILNKYPRTRDNDRELVRLYLLEHHKIVTLHQYVNNQYAPSFESIRRTRQLIQSAGELLPLNEPTLKRRWKAENNYRRYAVN